MDTETLTAKDKRKIEKSLRAIVEGESALTEHLLEVEDMVDEKTAELKAEFEQRVQEIKAAAPDINEVLRSVKGNQGDKGDKGDKGDPGIDGKDGKDGKDGATGPMGEMGPEGEIGPAGPKGDTGEQGPEGPAGKDGSPDTPDQVIEKIHTSKKLIKKEKIDGMADLERIARANAFNPTMGPSFADLGAIKDRVAAIESYPRVKYLTDAASITPDCGNTDIGVLITLSQDSKLENPVGTPKDGQRLEIRLKSSAVRALSYGTQYRGSTVVSLPSASTGSAKTDYMGFKYNQLDNTWDCLATSFGY